MEAQLAVKCESQPAVKSHVSKTCSNEAQPCVALKGPILVVVQIACSSIVHNHINAVLEHFGLPDGVEAKLLLAVDNLLEVLAGSVIPFCQIFWGREC